ncbi:MAG TPA: oligosaccharide flippase family protein [Candidatus Desulfobacillus sp.]|nr:oligosaccharide flippase family protein [Candidatus Desulfobacillus sp.]
MGLGSRSVSAVKWGTATTVLKYGLQFGVQVVMARILGPDLVGLFAMAMVVLLLVNFLADFGFGWAVLQKPGIDDRDVRFAFTWQAATGSLASLALFFGAGAIAEFFSEPRLAGLIPWLSPACLVSAIACPSNYLLRRKMDFRAIGLIELAGYAAGYVVVGLPVALLGGGVWALVAAWLAQAALVAALTMAKSRHPMRPLFWYRGAGGMLNVSMTVFVTNLCNWFLNNLDRILLGRMSNARALGHYSTGYNLASMPNMVLIGVLQPTFLAAGARLQDDRPALARAYLQVLAAVWVLIAPCFVLLAACADPLVLFLYGAEWARTGTLLALLALGMPAFLTMAMSTPVLWNSGRKHWETLLQLPILAALAAALLGFAGQSAETTAAAVVAAIWLRGWWMCWAAADSLRLGAADWRADLLRGVLVCAAVGAAAFAARMLLGAMLPPPALLLATGFAGGAVLAAIGLLRPAWLGAAANEAVARFLPRWREHLRRRAAGRASLESRPGG